jgi:DNA-binding protein HU-beta
MAVSKAEIIDRIAGSTGLTKKDVKSVVEEMLDIVTGTLKGGDRVQLTGFGTFEVRERKERMGVRPGTTERITIPASKYPAFKPGKVLKDSVQ